VVEWGIPFITPAWSAVVWAVQLSLVASIVVNALLLAYDAKWFRRLCDAGTCATGLIAGYWLYVVFPFDFGSAFGDDIAHLMLLLILFGMAIGLVVSLVQAVVELFRAPAASHR
jgi:hypothetical protein